MQASVALLRQPVHLLALGFGVGLVPVAPGTAATAAAGIAGWWLMPVPLPARAALVAVLALPVSGFAAKAPDGSRRATPGRV